MHRVINFLIVLTIISLILTSAVAPPSGRSSGARGGGKGGRAGKGGASGGGSNIVRPGRPGSSGSSIDLGLWHYFALLNSLVGHFHTSSESIQAHFLRTSLCSRFEASRRMVKEGSVGDLEIQARLLELMGICDTIIPVSPVEADEARPEEDQQLHQTATEEEEHEQDKTAKEPRALRPREKLKPLERFQNYVTK
ncbi:hypothetical protein AAHA92_10250 [Salvia divinorum]|uniref:Uncharacterized protein n=1 Tax=Salvia divinorum TaxID=28513 RepID=A0ABD1HU17_SALDI